MYIRKYVYMCICVYVYMYICVYVDSLLVALIIEVRFCQARFFK